MDWRDYLAQEGFNLIYKMIKANPGEGGKIIEEGEFKTVIEIQPRDGEPILWTKEQDLITKKWYYACEEPERLF